jgi:CHAT domain-containing protein
VGKLFKGEGMIALTRGLLYSGTSNIIFSLWKISDKHTSELMVEFYRQMISGKSYSESLKAAKLKLIKNQVTARPRSWAGFLLIGVD